MGKEDANKSPLVSVIIPCYNYGKFIEEAIDSVLASTYQNVEIIVVDDGPTDPFTIDLLKNLQKPKTRVIFQKNQGLACARNNGIRASRGIFFLPLDADDTIEPTMIEKCYETIRQDENIGMVYTYMHFFGDYELIWKNQEYNFYDLLDHNHPTVCSLVRKKAWEDVGGYDEQVGYEDWEFWIHLAEKGWYGKLYPEALFNYRKHGKSLIDDSQKKHKEILKYIHEKHSNIYSVEGKKKIKSIWRPRISVVIPCFNHGKFLKETLKSVLNQTFQDFEIIIVNDGSTDEYTQNVFQEITYWNNSKIRIIHQKNKGLAATRNVGIEAARGKYILPLDADDTIEPTMLEKCYWLLEMNPNLGIAYTGIRFFGARNVDCGFKEYDFNDLIKENFLTATSMFPRKLWEQYGGYDEQMQNGYEDWEFWIRIGKNGWQGKQIEEYLFNYRQHDISMRKESEKKHKELCAYIHNKHKDVYSIYSLGYINIVKLRNFFAVCYVKIKPILPTVLLEKFYKVHAKLKNVGVLNISLWVEHPLIALGRCIPIRIKQLLNRRLGKQFFDTSYFFENANKLQVLCTEQLIDVDSDKFVEIEENICRYLSQFDFVFFAPWISIGGADKLTIEYIRSLEGSNYKPCLITTIKPGERIREISIPYLDMNASFYVWKFLEPEQQVNILSNAIIKSGVKIIHIIQSDIALRMVKKQNKILRENHVKIIVSLFNPGYDHKTKTYYGYPVLYPEVMRESDIVLSDNQYWYAFFKKLAGGDFNFKKLFSPVDYDPKVKNNYLVNNKILWASRICNQKLIEVLYEVCKRKKNITFVIYGNEPVESLAKKYFKKMQKFKNVEFRGAYQHISELNMNEFDLFLFTSKFEGLAMIILDMVNHNIPIIASDVGDSSEIFGDENELLISDVQKANAYCKKIDEFYLDPKYYFNKAVEIKKKLVVKHNIEKFQREYLECVKSIN